MSASIRASSKRGGPCPQFLSCAVEHTLIDRESLFAASARVEMPPVPEMLKASQRAAAVRSPAHSGPSLSSCWPPGARDVRSILDQLSMSGSAKICTILAMVESWTAGHSLRGASLARIGTQRRAAFTCRQSPRPAPSSAIPRRSVRERPLPHPAREAGRWRTS